ncbi:MAG TPA: outer membrane beta-barrel protein [Longimicrobium sp.]|nr:outer membrane beta-barrel protein [Longimicrobium sp.]
MIRVRRLLAPALLLCAGLAQPALAQGAPPLSVEVRAGAGFPVADFNDDGATGWIVGGTVRYRVNPALDAYAGYDYGSFSPDDPDPDLEFTIRDQGIRSGVRAQLQAGTAPATPWIEAGFMLIRTSVSASSGGASGTVDAEWALGAEVGAGLSIALGPRASLTPGVRYRAHKADFGEELGSTTVTYFVVDLGVKVRL